MCAVYSVTSTIVHDAHKILGSASISPTLPVAILFAAMTAMMFASSCVNSLGALFLARDIDLVLSAPVTWTQFVTAKLLDVMGRSGWILIVFGFPAIAAMIDHRSDGIQTYVLTLLAVLPLLVTPTAAAITLATLFGLIIPANRMREVVLLATLLLGAALLLVLEGNAHSSVFNRVDIAHFAGWSAIKWVPSYWSAHLVTKITRGDALDNLQFYWLISYGTALMSVAAAYVTITVYYERALAKARQSGARIRVNSRSAQRHLRWMTPGLSQIGRAVLGKEVKTFSRDLTQTVQLAILLAISFMYLYNFRLLQNATGMSDTVRLWWRCLLILCNSAIGTFIVVAVCTRFVFPSVSNEGACWWILQTAPVSLRDILRHKLRVWSLPIMITSTLVHAAGACAIDAPLTLVLWTAFTAPIVAYGVTGLAVGAGAIFSNFEWEYSSQAATSFGSLTYMLLATVFSFIALIPFTSVLVSLTLQESGIPIPIVPLGIVVILCFALLGLFSHAAASWASAAGEHELKRRSN